MILILDNYDSFVHNVARGLRELGAEVSVVRSDRLTVAEVLAKRPTHVVISPGPGRPEDAGISLELVRKLRGEVPVLGICLGHQVVAEAYGARVIESPTPRHGSASRIEHRGVGLLAGLPSPFEAGRYHSLGVDARSLPPELEAVAWIDGGEVMALRHRSHPVWGVQFHPESILTPAGPRIFRHFVEMSAVPSLPASVEASRSEAAASADGLGPGGES